eukprot:8760957-Heterocapsa_arctica.AAC.1
MQGVAQHSLAAGHGYIAVHHVDPNFVRAFLTAAKLDGYITEAKLPVRIHFREVNREAATSSARLECPHNGFHLMILLDTRGPADIVTITKATEAAISCQVAVTMVEAWDEAHRRFATMAL